MEHALNLIEALCGFQFVITHLDGRQLLAHQEVWLEQDILEEEQQLWYHSAGQTPLEHRTMRSMIGQGKYDGGCSQQKRADSRRKDIATGGAKDAVQMFRAQLT